MIAAIAALLAATVLIVLSRHLYRWDSSEPPPSDAMAARLLLLVFVLAILLGVASTLETVR